MKFTPEGGIVSLAVRQKLSGGTANTTFRVADTGCGMSPGFYSASGSPSSRSGGWPRRTGPAWGPP